jgi:uncharacterized protein YkwD
MVKLVTGLLVLGLVGVWTGSSARSCSPPKPPALSLTADEALALRLVNAERTARGLSALALDPVLVEVARQHSDDMARRGYFAHLEPPPNQRTPLDRYAAALTRHPRTVVGENIARADEPLMELIHDRMMESPDHRANLLDPEYVALGVGIHAQPNGHIWLTQMFRASLPETR